MISMSEPEQALPALPPGLAARGIALRKQSDEDRTFLRELFVVTRWHELEPSGWSVEQKTAFLTQQFSFQDAHYTRHYLGAARGIITLNEAPVGRLCLFDSGEELRLVDIALLPAHRSCGIGRELLASILAQAAACGTLVSLHVESRNPARRLYERLGFVDSGGDEVFRRMERRPSNSLARPQSDTASARRRR
jgi:GNAT superfamily N-acetyltransferase